VNIKMKKLIVELLGTFFLVFTIFNVIASPAIGGFGALAIGTVLMVMVYCGGHISGAHYNPAVSIGLMVSGNFASSEYVKYIIYQCIGAVLGVVLVMLLRPDAVFSPLAVSLVPALTAEFIWTFLLAFVVLNVAVAKTNSGNSFYGFAIGATVLVGALSLGSISGGAFNPAVTLALAGAGNLTWATAAAYIVVQLAAGAVAGALFKSLVK
jgi:aquaporin Z